MIKKIITIICSVITFSALSNAANEKLDAVIAVVGDEIIMQSELDAYTNMRLSAMDDKPDVSKVNEYKKDFIKELVDGKILLAHAKDDTTIQISNQEVENAVKNHIASICQQNSIPMDSLESVLMKYQGMTLGRFKTESRRAIKEQMDQPRVHGKHLRQAAQSIDRVQTGCLHARRGGIQSRGHQLRRVVPFPYGGRLGVCAEDLNGERGLVGEDAGGVVF